MVLAGSLPSEVVHALHRCCVMDALAIENMGRVCHSWREAAADAQLFKDLIALRRGPSSVNIDGTVWNAPDLGLAGAWRKVFLRRALGSGLQTTRREST